VNGVNCIGCRRCVAACPYGAITFDEENRYADKCTGCYHRLFNTHLPPERRKPACVLTCTANTLHFDDIANIDAGVYGTANTTVGGPAGSKDIFDPTVTNPSVRFEPQTNIV
jgi:Fe-S-cluster-containing dehydrogenase component